jgi:hypothetical protein
MWSLQGKMIQVIEPRRLIDTDKNNIYLPSTEGRCVSIDGVRSKMMAVWTICLERRWRICNVRDIELERVLTRVLRHGCVN